MEFNCSGNHPGAKISIIPKVNAKGCVTIDIHPELEQEDKYNPTFEATYFAETKVLMIYQVHRKYIAAEDSKPKFIQRTLEYLMDVLGLDITCVSYQSLTNKKVTDLLVPLYQNATENQELIGLYVDSDALIAIPMVSALITLGFKELHIVPRSGPRGGDIGLEGVRSNVLSLRKIPLKSQQPQQQPAWSPEDWQSFQSMLANNNGQ